jgi:Putative prokaryotic signal transducing protein
MATVRPTVVANEVEAEVVCGELRANGIACFYRATDMGAAGMKGSGIGMGGPTETLVNEADLNKARTLVAGG